MDTDALRKLCIWDCADDHCHGCHHFAPADETVLADQLHMHRGEQDELMPGDYDRAEYFEWMEATDEDYN